MPITLGQNISSLRAQSQLNRGTGELSSVFERLSSGMRINSASDDAAGLSIATALNSDARVFSQAVRNVNDGISVLNIADSSLDNLTGIVTRIQELAVQAANGSLSSEQRGAIDSEAQALSAEYQRIARSTTFNGMAIFDSGFGRLNIQAGIGSNGVIGSGLGGAIGTGSFGGITTTAEGGSTRYGYEVAVADLNGDGLIDMVTAGDTDALTGYVNVRLGTGAGTFGAAVSYANEGEATWSIALEDINNDGTIDLVTAGDGGATGTATVRLGLGNGSFGAARSYVTESTSSYGIAMADLNEDGKLDLVTTGLSATGVTTVRFGAGDGTFGAATSYVAESGLSRQVRLVDLNGDGVIDLLSVGRNGTTTGYITARLGQGDGTFGASSTYIVANTGGGSFTWGMATGDFNGDGKIDVVAGSTSSAVMLGVGDGTFTAASTITPGAGSIALEIVAADFNGDGKLDLAVAQATAGTILYLGNGDGSFGGPSVYADGLSQTRALATADLNADGVADLIGVGYDATSDGYAFVRMTNTADGVGPLLPFSLLTAQGARSAMTTLSNKLTQLSSQRSQVGAFESRLTFANRMLESQVAGYREAAGRILDADVAADAAKLVALQIRTQAATAILAQTASSSELVLKLLG